MNYDTKPPTGTPKPRWRKDGNKIVSITIKESSAETENCKQSDVESPETPPDSGDIVIIPNDGVPEPEHGNKNILKWLRKILYFI